MNDPWQTQHLNERLCFRCGAPVPPGEGTYASHLNIITHHACASRVDEERDYSTSRRGR